MVDFLFPRDSYVFGDFGGGDLRGITTEGGLIEEEEEEVKWGMENGKWKNERRGRWGYWAADSGSGSGSVLLVEGLHEGRKEEGLMIIRRMIMRMIITMHM